MKGLLLKDFYTIRRQGLILLLLLAFYTLFFSMNKNSNEEIVTVFAMLTAMLTVILTISSFGYDELARWDAYAYSLPVGKSRIVAEKYLSVGILATACVGLSSAVCFLVLHSFTLEYALALYVGFGSAVFLCSVCIPLFYKFGMQKGRLAILFVFLIPSGAAYLLKSGYLAIPSEQTLLLLLKLSPLFLIAIVALSYFISVKIVQNKEL